MYVCVCNAVTERQIEHAIENGARRLRDLRAKLGVAGECGRCASCAHACLKQAAAAAPVGTDASLNGLAMEAL